MNWDLELVFHLPHDRLAVGWDWMRPDDECNYHTVKLYFLISTITINV